MRVINDKTKRLKSYRLSYKNKFQYFGNKKKRQSSSGDPAFCSTDRTKLRSQVQFL